MEKLKSSLTNMLVVLTVIAIIAAGVLAAVNAVTKPQIDQINADNLAQGIKDVMGVEELTVAKTDTVYFKDKEEKDANIQFVIYSIEKDGQSLGTAVSTVENGFGGPLKVLVGFDNEGTILGYTILEHAETPGLGAKADMWFQKGQRGDITGKNPGKCNFTVSKAGGEIDAITASTITSKAFLKSIQNAYDKAISGVDASTSATQQANGKCCGSSNCASGSGAACQCPKAESKHECKHSEPCGSDACPNSECGKGACSADGECPNKANCPKAAGCGKHEGCGKHDDCQQSEGCQKKHEGCPHAKDMGTPEVIE